MLYNYAPLFVHDTNYPIAFVDKINGTGNKRQGKVFFFITSFNI